MLFHSFCVQFLIDSETKASIFVVRSDARVSQALKAGARKQELLIPNAVAVSYLTSITFRFWLLDLGSMGSVLHFAWFHPVCIF